MIVWSYKFISYALVSDDSLHSQTDIIFFFFFPSVISLFFVTACHLLYGMLSLSVHCLVITNIIMDSSVFRL